MSSEKTFLWLKRYKISQNVFCGFSLTIPVEVDSVATDILGSTPRSIQHIVHSAEAGLGNCDLDAIEVMSLNQPTTQVHFQAPAHYSRRFPCQIVAEGACCTCMGNLVFALERLQEQCLLSKQRTFLVGQQAQAHEGSTGMTIAVGHCAAAGNPQADIGIDVCPPRQESLTGA